MKPYIENRPWGNFVRFTDSSSGTVKIITVKAGEALSLQYHKKRDEFWHIISGEGTITIGTNKFWVNAGAEYTIPKNTLHRVEAGKQNVVFLEIATGSFSEDDVVRTEDKYGRIK
ncbi:MAG: phosphomannose isomerase type II C-terminal cupin domain [Chitinophagaceae bacterium]|nr:phosphomannose isomerase type II C-terminal cupin domain [Chitinophagaceae bacterium]